MSTKGAKKEVKKLLHIVILTNAVLILFFSCSNNKEKVLETNPSDTRRHPYHFDSSVFEPVKFHPEVVSTHIDKFNTSFSPDGNTIYYTATSQKLGITRIAYQKFVNDNFTLPKFVTFNSIEEPVTDVHISPDGKLMLFSTFKDYEGKPEGFNFNIWISEFKDGSWLEPAPIGTPITSKGNEFYPVMINDSSIYFSSDKNGNADIYKSQFKNGKYQQPIRLPDNINSPRREADAFISRDESFMIFVRVDEPEGFGNSDLYISFREGTNKWSNPINMGREVNSKGVDGSPYVTPDSKYLIFTSDRVSETIKEKALKSYSEFKSINSSSNNGSLNFYIMNLDLDKYRK